MTVRQIRLGACLSLSILGGAACADGAMVAAPPPQAIPPAAPQIRPHPDEPATGIVLDYGQSPAQAGTAAGTALAPKTRQEIYAMLADAVKNLDNVAVIEHNRLAPDARPALSSGQLSVAEQPEGHFRLFAQIDPALQQGKAILHLQLLRAGHQGDGQDMAKPLQETTLSINPGNVRAAAAEVAQFLGKVLRIRNGHAEQALSRPQLAMWIEVKNADGSQGIKDGSKLVIYYQPQSNVYVNLYYLNSDNDIQRLIPSPAVPDNFARAGQIYRFPARGDGFTVTGKGTDRVRAVYTRTPSGIGADLGLGGSLRARETPMAVIPTQYPAIFATADLSRFFSLPPAVWNEKEIAYSIE